MFMLAIFFNFVIRRNLSSAHHFQPQNIPTACFNVENAKQSAQQEHTKNRNWVDFEAKL